MTADDGTHGRTAGRSLTALILEDELIIALDLEEMLRDMGFEGVDLATGVDEALASVAARQPDLALLDVNLAAGGSSARVAEVLLAAGVPFAFTTGYSTLNDLPESLRSVPILAKPVAAHALRRIVETLVGDRPPST